MGYKRIPLTVDQYRRLCLPPAWWVQDLRVEQFAGTPGIQRWQDTIAVMGSGDMSGPRLLNGIHAIAGFDHLVFERRPRPGEPAGNAYHWVIQAITDRRFPFLLHGPFKSETRVPHWFDSDDLALYWGVLGQRS